MDSDILHAHAMGIKLEKMDNRELWQASKQIAAIEPRLRDSAVEIAHAEAEAWMFCAQYWRAAYGRSERGARAAWFAAVVFCTIWLIDVAWRWIR